MYTHAHAHAHAHRMYPDQYYQFLLLRPFLQYI